MPSYAEWVSTTALALSVASLGWQVRRAALERPNLRAVFVYRITDDLSALNLSLTATNYGAGPVTITEVVWHIPNWTGRVNLSYLHSEEASESDTSLLLKGPTVPYRIQGHDQTEWLFAERIAERLELGEPARAAVYYVAPRKFASWRRTPEESVAYTDYQPLPVILGAIEPSRPPSG